ncbi:MAG: family 1 glycosylhydrolase [Verrucomicrobia bacterium]|nr:family 1 glycosylhydrolase [Verrucomicrobiota bacterium]
MKDQPFRWAAGIEGSTIPHLGIDEYVWTQHDKFWRQDFELAASGLGIQWLRYSMPWHVLEPAPGEFIWTWAEERFDYATELGLKLIIDLVHFGVPLWLPEAFADVDFPVALELFAERFGNHFRDCPAVHTICPINEPLTTAYFCGDAGLWPPHGHGLHDYCVLLTRLAQAFCRATRKLRLTMPNVEIMVCDSLEVATTSEPNSSEKTSPFLTESLVADVERRMLRRHIVMDLILGRVNDSHPLHHWLIQNGFTEFDLQWLARNRQDIDVIGLDYYNHTEVEIYTSKEGYYRQRTATKPLGLYRAAQDYWRRYNVPFMITETSATGSEIAKRKWFLKCIDDVKHLRADGFPCIGFTWWPLFDHLDWDGAMLHQTGHIHPVGIYTLQRLEDGTLERVATSFTEVFCATVKNGAQTAGALSQSFALQATSEYQTSVPISLASKPPSFVFFSHSRWSGSWKRMHHLASILQSRHPVLYIDLQWGFDIEKPAVQLRHISNNLDHLNLHLPFSFRNMPTESNAAIQTLVTGALRNYPLSKPAFWTDEDQGLSLFREIISPKITIYDCAYPINKPNLQQIRSKVDLVVYRSKRLAQKQGSLMKNWTLLPDGVEISNFSNGMKASIPFDVAFIRKPVVAFFGTADDRLDLKLMAALVGETLHFNMVMIGPVEKISPESLPRHGSVFWIGPRDYSRLGQYAAQVDLWILPYRRTEKLEYYIPKKLPEYLVTGRPVVSTDLPEIVNLYGGLIEIAQSRDGFISHCHRLLAEPNLAGRKQIAESVAQRSWETVALELEELVSELVW